MPTRRRCSPWAATAWAGWPPTLTRPTTRPTPSPTTTARSGPRGWSGTWSARADPGRRSAAVQGAGDGQDREGHDGQHRDPERDPDHVVEVGTGEVAVRGRAVGGRS